MIENFFEKTKRGSWGIAGGGLIVGASLATMVPFRGPAGERYSILNHFVSELGWLAESEWAPFWNASLVVGGALLVVFMVGLAGYLKTKLGYLGGVVGTFSAISCALVGIFPMDYLVPHVLAATGFFYGGMVAAGVFTLSVALDGERKIPRWVVVPGLVAIGFFVLFNFGLDFSTSSGSLDNFSEFDRPAFWVLPFVEWLVVLSINAWILIVSGILLSLERGTKREGN